MELSANEVLGAYQLGLITQEEARIKLGFTSEPIVLGEGK
jgi:hypothetical protein